MDSTLADSVSDLFEYRGYCVQHKQGLVSASTVPELPANLTAVFPGLGTAWPGMGRYWMQHDAFCQHIDQLQAVIDTLSVNCNLEHELLSLSPSWQEDPEVLFVVTVCMNLALHNFLSATLDLNAHRVVGHSLGELLCAAVALHLDDAAVVEMAVAMGRFAKAQRGLMMAVGADFDDIQDLLLDYDVHLACVNGPDSVTVASRNPRDLVKLKHVLNGKDILTKFIDTAWSALHIGSVGSSEDDLYCDLAAIFDKHGLDDLHVTWRSTVTGHVGLFDAAYLTKCLVTCVDATSMGQAGDEPALFVELGPHGILTNTIASQLEPHSACMPLLDKRDVPSSLAQALGILFVHAFIDSVPSDWMVRSSGVDASKLLSMQASFIDRHVGDSLPVVDTATASCSLEVLLQRALPVALAHDELHIIPSTGLTDEDGYVLDCEVRSSSQAVLSNDATAIKLRSRRLLQASLQATGEVVAALQLQEVTACHVADTQRDMQQNGGLLTRLVVSKGLAELLPEVVQAMSTTFQDGCRLQICVGQEQCVAVAMRMRRLSRRVSCDWMK
eukprot:TRINITY_DN9334_c1_g1_i1.p1 TRINITY_DN9334_c1_g1~~TRINITY_DN9334_c1_g1_i1.p1  ORF type:complete len:643 (+),score=164.45 TRINITY_DN9334_c1_g1_i1:262-1929(+)